MASKAWATPCQHCGKPFATTRENAKYCSGNCRQKASAARKRGGNVVELNPAKTESDPPNRLTYAEQFVDAVKAKLATAGRADEPLSLLALSLAEDAVNERHPVAARKQFTAEFRATYAEAMKGVKGADTQVDELRSRRDAARRAALG